MVMAKVNPVCKELLLGHRASIGLDDNYFRPNPDEVLQEYLKATDLLTINESNRLKRKVEELSKEQSEIEVMRLKHDQVIKQMQDRLEAQEKMMEEFKENLLQEQHRQFKHGVRQMQMAYQENGEE
jgi:hypothetical protein